MLKNHYHSITLLGQRLRSYRKNRHEGIRSSTPNHPTPRGLRITGGAPFDKLRVSKSAFTTIELLVVVSIILILASIAAPRLLRQPADANLVAALTELELLCQCAQHIAMASNENQKIMLDQQARRCTLTTKHHTWHVDLPETCRFGFSPSALGQPGDPREKITQAVTFPTENNTFVIIFDPTGLISAGTAYIIDKQESQLGALTCGVSQVSYLRKYLYKNRSWQLLN